MNRQTGQLGQQKIFSLTDSPSQSALSTLGPFVLIKARKGNASIGYVPQIVDMIEKIEELADRKSLGLLETEHICMRAIYIDDIEKSITFYVDHLAPEDGRVVCETEDIACIFTDEGFQVDVRTIPGEEEDGHVFRNADCYYEAVRKIIYWGEKTSHAARAFTDKTQVMLPARTDRSNNLALKKETAFS